MRKIISGNVRFSVSYLRNQILCSALVCHVPARVMSGKPDQLLGSVGDARRIQTSAYACQRIPVVNLDEPALKKYITTILNPAKPAKQTENLQRLRQLVTERDLIKKNISSLNELKQDEDRDEELKKLADEENESYFIELEELDRKILQLLVPRHAHESYSDIMIEISPGAGGQEAMLFASELLSLYENYATFRGWKFCVESIDKSDIGGIKSATVFLDGTDTFYYMQNEIGIHRVQRVPVTSAGGQIHTSTAAVIVLPQPTDVDIKIADKDLLIETMRASGPGGQKVNKTESAVRIKHLPTGMSVECQEHKSQHQNREVALLKLRTKLFDIEIQKQNKEIESTRQLQQGNRDRSEKIRTYNFPQNRITDHRCQVTCHNIKEVMEGGLSFHNFIEKLTAENEKKELKKFIANIQQRFSSEKS